MLIEIDEVLSTKITKQSLKQTYEDIEKEIQEYRVGSRVPLTEIQQEDLAQLLKMQKALRPVLDWYTVGGNFLVEYEEDKRSKNNPKKSLEIVFILCKTEYTLNDMFFLSSGYVQYPFFPYNERSIHESYVTFPSL